MSASSFSLLRLDRSTLVFLFGTIIEVKRSDVQGRGSLRGGVVGGKWVVREGQRSGETEASIRGRLENCEDLEVSAVHISIIQQSLQAPATMQDLHDETEPETVATTVAGDAQLLQDYPIVISLKESTG